MEPEVVIKVEHVSKKFCRSLQRSMFYGIRDIARNLLGLSSRPERLKPEEFWAVDDISFEVNRGEVLGIIGANGSGKTTILKMLNGIFWPDKGKITISDRVGALIAVGAGFHPLLTGRENIYINAAILGMTKKEVNEKFDDIVRFADIGDFLDTPVKNYSSGMFVRLGFAVAVHSESSILLVDEVLAVGDLAFQSKCFGKINELCKKGTTIVLVSHNMETIAQYADRVLYLDRGKEIFLGAPVEASEQYILQQTRKEALESIVELPQCGAQIAPVQELKDAKFIIIDASSGQEQKEFRNSQSANFNFEFSYAGIIESLQVGIIIYRGGQYIIGIDSLVDGISRKKATGRISGQLHIPTMSMMPGQYVAVLVLADGGRFLMRGLPISFYVVSEKRHAGVIDLPHRWIVN
ncbi:MAG: polysaccharide ABC transporter ATP-binding protein [Parcubacteria group bacterium]